MKKLFRNAICNSWKPAVLMIGVLLATALLASCGKDDEGPTRTDLLVGQWTLEEINGINTSSSFIVEVTFDRDGDYEEDINDSGELERYTGDWEWNSAESEITIDYDQPFSDWELDVDELTGDQLEVDDGFNTYLLTRN